MSNALNALEEVKGKAAVIKQRRMADVTTQVIIGTATCGISAGALEVVEAFVQEIRNRNLSGVTVSETGCSGRCALEPLVQVLKVGEPPIMYHHVTPEKARWIVQRHVQNNEVIAEWAVTD